MEKVIEMMMRRTIKTLPLLDGYCAYHEEITEDGQLKSVHEGIILESVVEMHNKVTPVAGSTTGYAALYQDAFAEAVRTGFAAYNYDQRTATEALRINDPYTRLLKDPSLTGLLLVSYERSNDMRNLVTKEILPRAIHFFNGDFTDRYYDLYKAHEMLSQRPDIELLRVEEVDRHEVAFGEKDCLEFFWVPTKEDFDAVMAHRVGFSTTEVYEAVKQRLGLEACRRTHE